jgi:hypothetical protein
VNGKIVAIAGGTGEGKTTLIKKYSTQCSNKKIFCYATVTSDFKDFPNIIIFTDFMKFLEAASKEPNVLCIIDEAYTCLPKKLNIVLGKPKHPHNRLAKFLVDSRKLNRFVLILFHALSQIPTEWLIPYLDYLIRFITNDLIQHQIQRFKSFPNIVENLVKFQVLEKYKPVALKMR